MMTSMNSRDMPLQPQKTHTWKTTVAAAASSSLLTLNMAGLCFLQFNPFEPAPFVPPPTPHEYFLQECVDAGYDCLLLNTIAGCESGWRMVKNATSSAYGYFQIIDATERGTPQYAEGRRKFDPYTNIDMGLYLYSRYGSSPWNESKGCWERRYWQAQANAE